MQSLTPTKKNPWWLSLWVWWIILWAVITLIYLATADLESLRFFLYSWEGMKGKHGSLFAIAGLLSFICPFSAMFLRLRFDVISYHTVLLKLAPLAISIAIFACLMVLGEKFGKQFNNRVFLRVIYNLTVLFMLTLVTDFVTWGEWISSPIAPIYNF